MVVSKMAREAEACNLQSRPRRFVKLQLRSPSSDLPRACLIPNAQVQPPWTTASCAAARRTRVPIATWKRVMVATRKNIVKKARLALAGHATRELKGLRGAIHKTRSVVAITPFKFDPFRETFGNGFACFRGVKAPSASMFLYKCFRGPSAATEEGSLREGIRDHDLPEIL